MKNNFKRSCTAGEVELLKDLWPKAFPGDNKIAYEHDLYKIRNGISDCSGLFEFALSKRGPLTRDLTHYRDFTDGSDAKKATCFDVTLKGVLKRRIGKISNINKKKGCLRCIVGCGLLKTTYYFKIPKSAYKNISTIVIRFLSDGTPNFGKWSKYQVNTWQELTH